MNNWEVELGIEEFSKLLCACPRLEELLIIIKWFVGTILEIKSVRSPWKKWWDTITLSISHLFGWVDSWYLKDYKGKIWEIVAWDDLVDACAQIIELLWDDNDYTNDRVKETLQRVITWIKENDNKWFQPIDVNLRLEPLNLIIKQLTQWRFCVLSDYARVNRSITNKWWSPYVSKYFLLQKC